MPKYKKNQIIEVVYQIRFSTILKINTDTDSTLSEFQGKIQSEYPNYQLLNEDIFGVKMSDNEINNIDNVAPQILKNSIRNHAFISEDGKTQINLTSNFISLSTQKYECWDECERKFCQILKHFNELYNISSFNRIGIRYVNAFSKEELGINIDESWDNYLSNDIVGLSSKYEVSVYNSSIEIPFEEDSTQMRLIYGLGTKQTENGLKPVFILDKDTYKVGNIRFEEVKEILNNLHEHNSYIFESLIKPTLREKMGGIENDK